MPETQDTVNNKETEERLTGKIYHLSDKGWGFISSESIPFTRIYFYWTGLLEDTLNFKDLKPGMKVEFTPIEIEEEGTDKIKHRAIKIRVLQ